LRRRFTLGGAFALAANPARPWESLAPLSVILSQKNNNGEVLQNPLPPLPKEFPASTKAEQMKQTAAPS
jgi:hypothetical protein